MYLVRKRALGDVLWIEPVIRAMAARHRHLTVISRYNELFLNYPLHNVRFRAAPTWMGKGLIWLEKRLGTRLLSVDLDGAYERAPHRHFLESYQEAAGLPIVHEYPKLYLSDAERRMDTGTTGPFVVFHLESMTDKNYRKIYGVDWAAVAAALRGMGYQVVQLGKSPEPIDGVEHRVTSLREMIALLSKAALFIGLDSGPSHIATALGVPSVLFFGAVNPWYRHFPELLKGVILQGACPYAGCFHDAPDPETMVCRLVGAEGVPVCSVHTTEAVLEAVDVVKNKYVC